MSETGRDSGTWIRASTWMPASWAVCSRGATRALTSWLALYRLGVIWELA